MVGKASCIKKKKKEVRIYYFSLKINQVLRQVVTFSSLLSYEFEIVDCESLLNK